MEKAIYNPLSKKKYRFSSYMVIIISHQVLLTPIVFRMFYEPPPVLEKMLKVWFQLQNMNENDQSKYSWLKEIMCTILNWKCDKKWF